MGTNTTSPSPLATAGSQAMPPKSLDDLIAEQGVRPLEWFDDLFGSARDWWTDEEFAAFQEHLKTSRREKD